MNLSKWFVKPEELGSMGNVRLLEITESVTNEIETDENNNYWKYRPFDEIRTTLQTKYHLSQDTPVVLYTREKLMAAARFAWLLHWIGCRHIRILIGQLDLSISIPVPSQTGSLPRLPLRPEVRLTCCQLAEECLSPTSQWIDVRTYAEYSGEITGYPFVRHSGHIPGFQFDPLDGIYGELDGTVTWQELEACLRAMLTTHRHEPTVKRIIYMCGTGWRASLSAIFADVLNLAETIVVLDSGWFEWSEEYLR